MPTQRLFFEGAAGDRLAARLELPPDGHARATALFAHCFTCSSDLHAAVLLTRALAERGIGVLRFDFTGLGESDGDFADTDFSSNVADLVAAAEFLGERVAPPSLLVGHSFGGAAVIQAATELASVRAVATVGAPFDPEHVRHLLRDAEPEIQEAGDACVTIAGREFRIRRGFLEDLRSQHVESTLAALDAGLLILHAPEDDVVDIENAALLFRAANHPKSFVALDGADHLLRRERDARWVGDLIGAWARRYLPEPPHVEPEQAMDQRVVARTGRVGYRTEIQARDHVLVADEPLSVGGGDEGPTPYDLVVAGLGACTGMTLRMYADRKKWPLDGVVVRLRHRKVHAADCVDCEEKDARIDEIEREIEVLGALDDEQRARLLEIANRCPVHRTLEGDIRVVSRLHESDEQLEPDEI